MPDIAPPRADTEDQLLLGLARTVQSDASASHIQGLLNCGVDWPAMLQKAAWHKVIPLLYRSLHWRFAGQTPTNVLETLRHHYTAIGRRNLYLAAELIGLLAFLKDRGIRAIPYKGPTAALLVYRDLHLRQFGDLDILVERRDYARTRALLLESGYRPDVDWGWESSLVDDDKGLCVDLHQAITPEIFPARLAWADIRKRLVPVTIAGRAIDTLSAEDMLLVLCIQLAKDAWGENSLRLSKICDIAELLRSHPDLDMDRVLRASRRAGCRRILQLGLAVAHELLDAPVSEAMLAGARNDRRIGPLMAHVHYKLFRQRDGDYVPPLSIPAFHFMVRERWRDKLYPRYHDLRSRLAPNEKDREFLPLPDPLHFLYYLIRPVRVARDHARRLFDSRTLD